MDLARKKLIAKRNVSPHNRLKIFEFLDYLETQEISLPRRIRYLQQMSKKSTSTAIIAYDALM